MSSEGAVDVRYFRSGGNADGSAFDGFSGDRISSLSCERVALLVAMLEPWGGYSGGFADVTILLVVCCWLS